MQLSLPEEIWALVAQHLVCIDPDDERGAHEQWQIYMSSPHETRNRFHPLKAFSQTCKLFASIALPMLWRHVYLVSKLHHHLFPLSQLVQLKVAFECTHIASLTRSITVNARGDEYLDEQMSVGCAEESWRNHPISDFFPTTADFMSALEDLGRLLPGTNISEFSWRGIYRPPPAFYDGLAKCTKLNSFTLDLARHRLPCADPRDYPPWDDALDKLASLVQIAKLGFGGDWHLSDFRNDIDADDNGAYYDLRDSSGGFRGTSLGLVQWLSSTNKLETLYLAAPILYHQPWTLVVWAKLVPQDVDQEAERNYENFDQHFGEPIKEIDLPYERAAKAFRPLLLKTRCETPEDVLQLIKEREELQVWQKWHYRLQGETKDVMEKIIAVLQMDGAAPLPRAPR